MKKYVLWPLLAAIGGVGAFLLRLLQRSTGFEVDTGLPIPGNLYAILLVAWFVVLAAVCLLAARPLLPADREDPPLFPTGFSVASPGLLTPAVMGLFLLTASGGPFFGKKAGELQHIRPADALKHPNWDMGAKVTIDSSTLMNKGLEVIEAHHLFGVPAERIRTVIHPQSVIHSMVQYGDGAVLAQMGPADMCMPIAWCLGYPERLDGGVDRLDFTKVSALTFEEPDTERFPQLSYAYEALNMGGISSIVLNAANEVGVRAFLDGRIRFTDIAKLCSVMMSKFQGEAPASLEEILAADKEARQRAQRWVAQKSR